MKETNSCFLRIAYTAFEWHRGIVVIDFDCYTGDRGLIPTHGDSLGKWMNLCLGQPMPCEGDWVVSPRCWQDIDLHSVYNCENGLLSPKERESESKNILLTSFLLSFPFSFLTAMYFQKQTIPLIVLFVLFM